MTCRKERTGLNLSSEPLKSLCLLSNIEGSKRMRWVAFAPLSFYSLDHKTCTGQLTELGRKSMRNIVSISPKSK